ncbi:hypothetical protein IWW36_003066 [Coemansia brasiliensis]|uniref:U6 small nuclear RNA (adenine-(43)-N(6))-methyltransferase n=1 Tax=Coemansia brasiliensis TaxID=2650707 RepID=A0A9W8ICC1_9FUNG|nr:hypothetical protein IWW36_003066 [Coemansia brasiliensis]
MSDTSNDNGSDLEAQPSKRIKTNNGARSLPDHISYKALAEKFPKLKGYLVGTKATVDFQNPDAVRTLNQAILRVFFDLDVHLPANSLCPTVANRLHYLEWIRSNILADFPPSQSTIGMDIGCGASCIYPLLGVQVLNCLFVGTDINSESIECAQKNVVTNHMGSKIRLFLNNDQNTTLPLDAEGFPSSEADADGSVFTFSMCNPPFYKSRDERQQLSQFKSRSPSLDTNGKDEELYTEGGEEGFLTRMIDESVKLGKQIKWYTTMVGKKSTLSLLKTHLRQNQARHVREGTLLQGKTTRWVLAWTFLEQTRFVINPTSCSKENMCLSFKDIMNDLHISMETKDAEDLQFVCQAKEKTWTRQWRRQQKRNENVPHEKPQKIVLQFTAIIKETEPHMQQIELFLEPGYPSNLLMSLYNHLSRRI